MTFQTISDRFSVVGKLVVLRLHRLGRVPPGLSATEILQEQGYPILVVEYGNVKERVSRVEGAFPRLRLQSPWAAWLPSALRSMALWADSFFQLVKKILVEGHPEFIIAHGLSEQTMALFLRRLFGIRYAVHVHEIYDSAQGQSRLNRFFLFWERDALRSAEFLIVPEKNRARILKERYQLATPVHLVFNCPRKKKGTEVISHPQNSSNTLSELALKPGTEVLNLRKEHGLSEEAKIMYYMGGIGPSNCLEAAITSLVEVPKLYFFVWGWGDAGYIGHLKELASRLGLAERVKFLGEVPDKWSVIPACDFSYCVYGSQELRLRYCSTASNKIMEAIACGVPVITSPEPSFREFVTTFDVGVALEDLTSTAVVRALRALLIDPKLYSRLAYRGTEAHRTTLNYEFQFQPVLQNLADYFTSVPVLSAA